MSFFRLLIGIPIAAIVTVMLFLVMGDLIKQEAPTLPAPSPYPSLTISPQIKEAAPDKITGSLTEIPDAPQPPTVTTKRTPTDPGPIITIPAPIPPSGGEGGPTLQAGLQGAILTPPPIYPQSCLNKGIGGTATVQFDVTTNGNVINARVISSSHKCFERQALRAIEKWKFSPALGAPKGIARYGLVKTFRFTISQ